MLYKMWEWRGVLFIAIIVYIFIDIGTNLLGGEKTCHSLNNVDTIYGHSLDRQICVKNNTITDTFSVEGTWVYKTITTKRDDGWVRVDVKVNEKQVTKLRNNPVETT